MHYILSGKDASMTAWQLDEIIKKEKPDVIERYDASADSWNAILDSICAMSLFMDKTMIVIENMTMEKAGDWLEKLAAALNDDKIVVMVNPGSISAASLYKAKKDASKKQALADIKKASTLISCKTLDEKSVREFLQPLLRQKKVKVDARTLDWMCANMALDAVSLEREAEKLSLFSSSPSLDDVKSLVAIGQSEQVFAMTDALFARDSVRLLSLYRHFRQDGMETFAIIGLLASQVRAQFQVRAMMDAGYSDERMMDALSITSSGRLWHMKKKAARFSSRELMKNLSMLSKMDEAIKSGTDKDLAFENYVLSMVTAGR